jgi:hypothetical protein
MDPPSGLASSCAHAFNIYTDSLCLLADPLAFEAPPPGILVAQNKVGVVHPITVALHLDVM